MLRIGLCLPRRIHQSVEKGFPQDSRKELLAAAISIGGILAGFLGTAKTILLTLQREVQSRLRISGYLDTLMDYLGAAMLGSLTVAVVSVIGFFPIASSVPGIFGPLWIGIFVFSVLAFWRVSRVIVLLLRLDPDKV